MKLSAKGRLELAARAALATGFAFMYAQPAAVYAQDEVAENEEAQLETYEVIGTRLRSPSLTSTSSMTVVNPEELDFQGTINVETMLNSMPQVFAEFSSNDSNGATGTATVSLRGLGSQRTLVLIDGRRLMPGDPFVESPDLNFIPAALIERTEILSGGASAVYGSDAIAGVVNFEMKKDFEGFQVDAQGTQTAQGDAGTRDISLMWGSNFAEGDGNIVLYAGLTTMEPLTQDKRSFSECSLTTQDTNKDGIADRQICAGSGTIPEGRWLSYDRYYASLDYYALTNPDGSRTFIEDDGRTYNFAPTNFYQRDTTRYNLGGFVTRQLNDYVESYGSFMFMDNNSLAQVAPGGLFYDSFSVPCSNPYMSADQRAFLCDDVGLGSDDYATVLIAKRMSAELGPRQSDIRHTDYRFNLGFRGDIADGITYDVNAQRGEVIYQSGTLNYAVVDRVQNALDATVDGNGDIVCAGGDKDGCVPIDLFALGAITDDQTAYFSANGYSQANLVEQILSASVSADLTSYGVVLPTAVSGVGIGFGTEYRSEDLDYRPDDLVENGTLGGVGGPSPGIKGDFDVQEVFGEIRVPLIENQPFSKMLMFEGAYRTADYSLAGQVEASKYGMQWAPVNDVLIRASFQDAVRAPSINELFSPQAYGLFGGSDPCAGKNLGDGSPTFEECARTGVTEEQYYNQTIRDCSSGQCNALYSGNINLKPEESETFSYGFVLTPSFLKNFSLTVDYFDISIDGAIQTVNGSGVLSSCLKTGEEQFCSLINRGPTGTIWGDTSGGTNYVDLTTQNIGYFNTTGWDVEANYRIALGGSNTLSFNYVATYLASYEVEEVPGYGSYDCAGLYGLTCGTPNPEYRHKLRMTWVSPIGLTTSVAWRHFGQVVLDTNSDQELLSSGFNSIDGTIPAANYLDLAANYALPIPGQDVTLRFAVNNVLDEEPKAVSSGGVWAVASPPYGNGNTFPNVYDILGPNFVVGLTAKF